MDKMIDVPAFTHVVKINDRKNIVISGIKKIISFDDKEFLLESSLGNIIIKGSTLEMIKLDTLEGNVSIKGKIDSFMYTDIVNKEISIISKLFR
ncbi:MAG: sporulation protein YabP [Bacilli bacterium]|nr:sporulation protein YabP [Bacilli bacterium]MDD3895685.1 sporulation protein YabP [Bacilli bacterium]